MKLINKGEAFEMSFAGKTLIVPAGEFEMENIVGGHIVYTAKKWGKDVIDVDTQPAETAEIPTAIAEEAPVEETTPAEEVPVAEEALAEEAPVEETTSVEETSAEEKKRGR